MPAVAERERRYTAFHTHGGPEHPLDILQQLRDRFGPFYCMAMDEGQYREKLAAAINEFEKDLRVASEVIEEWLDLQDAPGLVPTPRQEGGGS